MKHYEIGRDYKHFFSVRFKHILLVNTKGLGVAKLRGKPLPKPFSSPSFLFGLERRTVS